MYLILILILLLILLYSNPCIKVIMILKRLNLDDKDWEVLDDISRFFEVFARATSIAQLMNILHFSEPSPNISLSCENSNPPFSSLCLSTSICR
jgi:hypothetical protein